MTSDDREREFRLRPPKPRRNPADETRIWSIAFKRVMHIARMSGSGKGPDGSKRVAQSRRFQQRCAVRVTYSTNKAPGQWKGHGRYIARATATHKESRGHEGFGRTADGIPIDAALHRWQLAGDRRLFKLIVSPEFGDRLDLKKLVRNLMLEMERDLGTTLEWVAAEHHNTEYPHVHVALRGIDQKGRTLQLPREYVQFGIRKNAERLATAQIGYRTARDTEEAQRREVHQKRYTSLDRIISSRSTGTRDPQALAVDLTKRRAKTERCILNARLLFLQKMGLAGPKKSNRWLVRSDFETILRAMQRTDDRQRSLAAHGVPASDPRLPSRLTDLSDVRELEGRILGHGEEEFTGRTYTMLEGTDHHIHFIYRSPDLEIARRQGRLATNSFVRLTTQLLNQRFRTKVQYFGNADELLSNHDYLKTAVRKMLHRGLMPTETHIGGWLGRYEAKLFGTLKGLEQVRDNKSRDNLLRH